MHEHATAVVRFVMRYAWAVRLAHFVLQVVLTSHERFGVSSGALRRSGYSVQIKGDCHGTAERSGTISVAGTSGRGRSGDHPVLRQGAGLDGTTLACR